ncbi:hypothetical protein [Paenibacillus gallinarum]|uniref:Copper amine oxidase-like N-terminal domain-containing protein n=1 Tax=Paenibacillus gallinarum TaxID=2762232 RepID=A0ABR8SVN2_9BACL|nr:hypothetical protein [Paenibacillus gallinarum]MBD7967363.1 hypothetical protein [Paenibacillus gallinarum]
MKKTILAISLLSVIFMGSFTYGNLNYEASTVLAKPSNPEVQTENKDITDTTKETIYITNFNNIDGQLEIQADDIEWFEGKAADEALVKNEPNAGIDYAPDGYYIVNDDPSTYELKVAPDAEVLVQIYDRTGQPEDIDINWNEKISLEKFIALYNQKDNLDMSQFPYHVTVQDGEVIQIVQQYIP